jgi:hypothetical protein
MESLKTRQCTVKNTPIPESAKCFDKPIPWYALEVLKLMGRMDGDMATNSTGYEVAVEWRQKCEQLQGRITQLEAQLKAVLNDHTASDENVALRIIVKHLVKLL